jgi:hypothetical protein
VIYICIPALNEARTIGVLLWKIRQVMDEFPRDYHVLVLDDGSTDDTREVLEPYLRVLPVTVLRNERTQGYSAGLERLVREAVHRSTHPKRDGVVTLQADFTESPDDIPALLKRLEGGADVVGVTVKASEEELPRSIRWSRKGLPWLLSRAPLPREVGDPLCGFRAYRVAVLRRALQDVKGPLLTKHGWAANAELLLAVLPHVRRAEGAEVTLRYSRRERPTRFRPWSTALELWDLARKAPRRLARARAAAAAAEQRQAAAPAPAQPRAPQPAVATEGPTQVAAPAPRHGGQPRPHAPRPAPPKQRQHHQRPPREAPVAPAAPPEAVETVAAAEAEAPPAARPKSKRRRPPRRKPSAAQAVPADVPDAVPAEAPAAAAPAEAGEAPAKRKRASRPRRPRRPHQPQADAPAVPPPPEGGGGE